MKQPSRTMSKKKRGRYLTNCVAAGALLASTFNITPAQAAETCDTVNVGYMAALSGPDSGWGLPGLTGVSMFLDEVNERGGLSVGDCLHPLELFTYDDEGSGGKALQGAKELVLRNKVKIILSLGGNPADAVHPFLTQQGVIYTSLSAPDSKPDRPYLMVGGDVTPRMDMLRPVYLQMNHPELTRWAVASQDDVMGLTTQPWEVGAAKATGWDVVYDKHFAVDTTDFAPIVTDILSSNPEVVSLDITWPDFAVLIVEQLYQQGFKGKISGNFLPMEQLLAKVPAEYLEGAVEGFPNFNDPWFGELSAQRQFYDKWISRFGPGAPEDVKRDHNALDWDYNLMLEAWAWAAEEGGSLNPDVIFETLRNAESIPTLLGPAVMGGEDMYGIKNMLSYPVSIVEVRNGEKRIQARVQWANWWPSHAEQIIEHVKSTGQYWDQRN